MLRLKAVLAYLLIFMSINREGICFTIFTLNDFLCFSGLLLLINWWVKPWHDCGAIKAIVYSPFQWQD